MKTFKTLLILFIGSIFGLSIGALLIFNGELEAEKEEWQSKISELETLIESKLAGIPEKVTSEVSSIFPLAIKDLGGGVQLTTAKTPQELEAFLDNLSQFTENKINTLQEVSSTRAKIISAVNQLPALERQSLADQIILAEWSLNALDLLSEETHSSELLPQLIFAQTLSDSIPLFVPAGLESAVQKRANALANQAEKQIIYLATNEPIADLASLREGALLADVMIQSGLLDDQNMANQLVIRLRIEEWLSDYRNLKRQAYGSEEEFDLARYNLVEEGSAVVELAVNLEVNLPNGYIPSLRKYSKGLAEEQRKSQGKIRAEYQIWAIGEIEQANKMIADTGSENISKWLKEARDHPDNNFFQLLGYLKGGRAPKFSDELLKTAKDEGAAITTVDAYNLPLVIEALGGIASWKGQSEMAKALTADALLEYLTPVDESLLDRTVAALYSEAFNKAWNYIEGTDYRLQVAKEAATVSKRHLSE